MVSAKCSHFNDNEDSSLSEFTAHVQLNPSIFEYIYETPPDDGVDLPLSAVSEKDSIWDTQRTRTAAVGDIYGYNSEFGRYHERMTDCSTFLSYGINSDDALKLKHANFCRVRHCPVCQWRRSLLWKSNMYVAYDEIKKQYPTGRWVFLTLTVRNCEITNLRDTLRHMNQSWQRLIKRKEFSVVNGWIRTTEITRPKEKNNNNRKKICSITGNTHAHPHFHVMLFVKASYFSTGYITQQRWSDLWREVLRVDYQPIVDVRAVKAKKKRGESEEDAVKSAVMETLKYSVKPDDMIGDGSAAANEWFYELTRQAFKMRFIASGGVLKNALRREDEITDKDLVNTGSDDNTDKTDNRRLVFTYSKPKKCYLYNPKYNQ